MLAGPVASRPERACDFPRTTRATVSGGRDQPAHVQRRRRQHDPLHRDLDAARPVRLPRANARRRRRRLADLVRGSAPLLRAVDVEMGVSGLGGDPAYPPGAPPPLPPHPIGEMGRKAAQGMNRLGWHWWPGTNAIASRPHGRLAQCERRATCQSGLPSGAKASTDLTHWPDALRHGARLVTGARVREIVLDGRGRARGAVYVDRDGKEHLQEASIVVLAANGVGTPRLLLLSTSPRFPDGLANSSGLVGRRLMLHPGGRGPRCLRGRARQLARARPVSLWVARVLRDRPGPRLPARSEVGSDSWLRPAAPPLAARSRPRTWGPAIHESTATARRTGVRLVRHRRGPPRRGKRRHARSGAGRRRRDPGAADLLPAVRELAGQRSSSTSRAQSKRTRQPGPSRRSCRECHADCGWHLMGTARIGVDPLTSVCDPFGRTHDVPNLFVADGSVFVTAGAMNPTATICAFALRQRRAHRRVWPGCRRRPSDARGSGDARRPRRRPRSGDSVGCRRVRSRGARALARPGARRSTRPRRPARGAPGRARPGVTRARRSRGSSRGGRSASGCCSSSSPPRTTSSPKVRRLIGYPGQRAVEVFPDQAEHDLRDGILDPVIARGPIWRRASESAQAAGASGSETANVAPPPGVGE